MKVIALAGNPNVGKSTIFNTLTGMKQHTGNWPGKTVSNASGMFNYKNENYMLYDLPGTYSLIAHSEEETIARDYLCFNKYDKVIVVCDAVCLERNLILVLQTLEITKDVVVCVNLMDEAKKKKIKIDINKLSNILGVPVIATSARKKQVINDLLVELEKENLNPLTIKYNEKIEEAIDDLLPYIDEKINNRWLALNLINYDKSLYETITKHLGKDLLKNKIIRQKVIEMQEYMGDIKNEIVTTIVKKAEEIAKQTITFENIDYESKNRKIDKILTSKLTGIPIMICLLLVIFWITISGANYPSAILFDFFSKIEQVLLNMFNNIGVQSFITGILINGVYKVLTWVISVMLPPMAIFFPLFTILEDLGYLPRIAFNLDKIFKKCNACGKQALTMCMGFGCNAVGVTGARIIDSKRERLIAIVTNVFVPCNGRFPTMISIISIFFVGINSSLKNSLLNVLILLLLILLGVFLTFIVSFTLSKTILKGMPSSFTLELPPYRRPQIIKTIIRSIFDKTLKILGRSIVVAAPTGAFIWLLSNINIGSTSLLIHIANFLNPLGEFMGLDGIILIAFLLGFPANEIVIPIMLMGYLSTNTLVDFDSLESLRTLLVNNGWTIKTALCMLIFSLCHFPCSTTCLTIKKETGSLKWTLISIIIPTLIGIFLCSIINMLFL